MLHKCVIAEIINSRGEFVLVKQADDRQDPGQFVSPVGGHVRSGETDEDALRRESLEEVGYRKFEFKFKERIIFNRPARGKIENHFFLLYEIYSDDLPILGAEAVDFATFSKEKIKEFYYSKPEVFGDAFKFLLNTAYKNLI